jgi:hypothetical protein
MYGHNMTENDEESVVFSLRGWMLKGFEDGIASVAENFHEVNEWTRSGLVVSWLKEVVHPKPLRGTPTIGGQNEIKDVVQEPIDAHVKKVLSIFKIKDI